MSEEDSTALAKLEGKFDGLQLAVERLTETVTGLVKGGRTNWGWITGFCSLVLAVSLAFLREIEKLDERLQREYNQVTQTTHEKIAALDKVSQLRHENSEVTSASNRRDIDSLLLIVRQPAPRVN